MEELDAAGLLATPARPAPRQIGFEDIVRLTYLRCVIKVPLFSPAQHYGLSWQTPQILIPSPSVLPLKMLCWAPEPGHQGHLAKTLCSSREGHVGNPMLTLH